MGNMNYLEICAGAGGQALGLEEAGFEPLALIEIDEQCRRTLTHNRPNWNVIQNEQCDVRLFNAITYKGLDLLAGGLPCPPFSKAGKQIGENDERNLFPDALRLVDECRPRAVMFENVRGFLDDIFYDYRLYITQQLEKMGYVVDWRLLNASDFGVSQLRPRVVIVAILKEFSEHFSWAKPYHRMPQTVGELIFDQISARKWKGAENWKNNATSIAPTIVGGSKKHGGPDLGPTRARLAWAKLGVDGTSIAEDPPSENFIGMPRLTVEMVARIQGFPDNWYITGKKTPAYRQVANAFPPPVAKAIAQEIMKCLTHKKVFSVAG